MRPTIALGIALLLAGRAADAEETPSWLVTDDASWVRTYFSSLEALCRVEKREGRMAPLFRRAGRLPVAIYASDNTHLRERKLREFNVDVSGVKAIYLGAPRGITIRDAVFVDRDGREFPFSVRGKPQLPHSRVAGEYGEFRMQGDMIRLRWTELRIEIGGRFKYFKGDAGTHEWTFFWIDSQPRFDEWAPLVKDRYWLQKHLPRIKYADKATSDKVARGVKNDWRFLPSCMNGVDYGSAATAYANSISRQYGAVDAAILKAIAAQAGRVRSAADFERLTVLAHAARNYDTYQRVLGQARMATHCPGLVSEFEPITKEYYKLDARQVDYEVEMLQELLDFERLVAACNTSRNHLKVAKATLDFVDKVNPVADSVRRTLAAYEDELEAAKESTSAYNAVGEKIRLLRRKVVFTHPDLNIEKILVNRTPPTTYSHNCDQYLGRTSRVGPGLTVISNWKTDNPKASVLLGAKLPRGSTRSPDLSFDGDKVVFAFCSHEAKQRDIDRRFFIYEAAIDGSSVRQLTGTARDDFRTWMDRKTVLIEDQDPCYLPDGDIMFVSTRSQTFGRCHGGRYAPAFLLHRCDRNGNEIQQLSWGSENEYEPAVLHDGRVVFTRWEYISRHEMLYHMLWWTRPDGTGAANYYGNDTQHPMMVVEATPLPESNRVVATATAHHSFSTGTLLIVDPDRGENGEEPLTHLTPHVPYPESLTPPFGNGDGWPAPNYSHPFPITDEFFLVSRGNYRVPQQKTRVPEADRGIYLIDIYGGEELIYNDPSVASFSPIPIRSRKRPPVLPSSLPDNAPEYGTLFIQNVYLTRNDPKGLIKPGSIKAIRVNELGCKPTANAVGVNLRVGKDIAKRVLGTVPVEGDGSAFFRVPARKALQLQILDENGMAVLTEMTFNYLQPGENRSCIGCHEPPGTSPVMSSVARNASRRPRDLTPPPGQDYEGGLSFLRTVQPVLDRHCISCHGLDKKEHEVDLIGRGTNSCAQLHGRGRHWLGQKYANMHRIEFNISRPFYFFAHSNKVAKMLLKGHNDVKLSKDEFTRIVQWMDLNAQTYGDNLFNKVELREFDTEGEKALRAHIAGHFGDKLAGQPLEALVNRAEVEQSRILLAPLTRTGGGWGQIAGGWASREDPGFKTMAALVRACIVPLERTNVSGTCGSFRYGGRCWCGCCWVPEARRKYVSEAQRGR